MVSGQNKQTQVQEWTQWKQWALDHKDFDAFKNDFFDKVKKYNEDIDKKLSDPEFQKEVIEPILQIHKNDLLGAKVAGGIFAVLFIVLPIIIIIDMYPLEEKNENSYLPSELMVSEVNK